MKHRVKRHLCHLSLAVGLTTAALTSCVHYRFDAPSAMIQAPGAEIWGVNLQRVDSGYRTHSVTRLNGTNSLHGEPTSVIATGSTGSWRWEVRAVPSLLPSWKTWQGDKKVQQRAGNDDWSHPAATWEQAFARAHKVASYLLGRSPLPMKLTVLLVPDGSTFKEDFVQTGSEFVPLTLAFYYPSAASDSSELTSSRFAALVEAVSRAIYEYQHILVDTEIIKPIGNNEADRTINNEARSQCWFDSTYLALTSGTHTELRWNPAPEALLEGSSGHETSLETEKQTGDAKGTDERMQRRYSDAVLWGKYLDSKSVSAYLREKGIQNGQVISNEPTAMNAALSVCRAMTQNPLDLTAGSYPASRVEYVPFFPITLNTK